MTAPIRHALIMAAGRGARMMPLTAAIPKPMAPYKGSTLIANGIHQLQRHIQNVHVTVGYKGAMLAEHVINIGVKSVFDTSNQGNAWWIFNTLLRHLDEPLLVLTSDNVVQLDFARLAGEFDRLRRPACMVVPVMPVEGLEGDYIFLDGNQVTRLDRNHRSDRYCSGIQVLIPARVNSLVSPKDDFYAVWADLISKGELYSSSIYVDKWFSVDTVAQLEALNHR